MQKDKQTYNEHKKKHLAKDNIKTIFGRFSIFTKLLQQRFYNSVPDSLALVHNINGGGIHAFFKSYSSFFGELLR